MERGLSIPVIWRDHGGAQHAGRLDLGRDRLTLEGGSRDEPRRVEIAYADIVAARIGRSNGDRIGGRSAIVLRLVGGGAVSLAGFDRPGTTIELLHRLEERLR
jgi:hypothetical protein